MNHNRPYPFVQEIHKSEQHVSIYSTFSIMNAVVKQYAFHGENSMCTRGGSNTTATSL